jgi:hypothetical protein
MLTQITLISVLLGLFWYLLVMRGGLLQVVSQWANNDDRNRALSVLLQCPYCMAGQIALMLSFICIFKTHDFTVILSVPLAVNITYILFTHLYKTN